MKTYRNVQGSRSELFVLRLLSEFISGCMRSLHMSSVWGGVVNEPTAKHRFQIFRSGDFTLFDDRQNGRPQAMDDEACIRLLSRTVVQCVVNFQNSLKCLIKQLDFIYAACVIRTGWTSEFRTSCCGSTRDNERRPVCRCFLATVPQTYSFECLAVT